jgi:hypothetical protein
MKFNYSILEDDYVGANKLFLKPTRRTYLGWLFFVVLFFFGVYVLMIPSEHSFAIRVLASLISAVVLSFIIVRISVMAALFQCRRNYRKSKYLHYPQYTYELTDDGILSITQDGNGMIRWENILKWRYNDDYVLIYSAPNLFCFVPLKQCDSPEFKSRLFELLQEKVGNPC